LLAELDRQGLLVNLRWDSHSEAWFSLCRSKAQKAMGEPWSCRIIVR